MPSSAMEQKPWARSIKLVCWDGLETWIGRRNKQPETSTGKKTRTGVWCELST